MKLLPDSYVSLYNPVTDCREKCNNPSVYLTEEYSVISLAAVSFSIRILPQRIELNSLVSFFSALSFVSFPFSLYFYFCALRIRKI